MNAQVQEGNGEASEAPKRRPTEITTVTMEDGRVLEFAGKRKLLKESIIDDQGVAVRLDFRNGKTVLFRIPDSLMLNFAGHGAEQKLGDATAGEDDVDDMVLAVEELAERLNKGEWSMKREAGGMSGTSVLLQALVKLSQQNGNAKSVEEVKAFLKPKTAAEKMALRNSKQLKPIVEEIEVAKAAKSQNIDTDALLATL